MKTTIKLTALIACIFLIALFNSCKKEAAFGKMNVSMTDAPGPYTSVNVEVIGLDAHIDNIGWISLPVNAGVYDLLSLQNNVSVVLANNANIPVGKLSQIRLRLGSNNTISDSLAVYPLKVPSGEESGLKINVHQDIQPNNSVDILLDFDANASVVRQGNGSFSLKPVITIKSVIIH